MRRCGSLRRRARVSRASSGFQIALADQREALADEQSGADQQLTGSGTPDEDQFQQMLERMLDRKRDYLDQIDEAWPACISDIWKTSGSDCRSTLRFEGVS